MQHLVKLIVALLLLTTCSGQHNPNIQESNTIRDSCTGRVTGFARDLTSCPHYFYCKDGAGHRGVCDDDNLFDAEIDYCVQPANENCFRCPREGYHTFSVPHACGQFIECLYGQSRLRICSGNLVYDGRKHVQQCNRPPAAGGCYREDSEDEERLPRCPSVNGTAIFVRDPYSCSRYFVCSGNKNPEVRKCQPGLHINIQARVCDTPERAGCNTLPQTTPRPPPTTTTRPPLQPGPAKRCIVNAPPVHVPCRVTCHLFYTCNRDGSYRQETCGDSLRFDHRIRKCTAPGDAECWAETRPPIEQNDDQFDDNNNYIDEETMRLSEN